MGVVLLILRNFYEHLFYRRRLDDSIWTVMYKKYKTNVV